jgi:pimeloyl-ACP methyl ester carboxylesterase
VWEIRFARLLSRLVLVLAVSALCAAGAPAPTNQLPQGSFVSVKGGQIWYQTCGNGTKALVLIHDGILHSATWDAVWPLLCRDFHVVRYDRRGFGQSAAATVGYSPLDDLSAVMRAASIGHAVLVGSASGGGLAVDFTLAHPDAVDGLVLVGPSVSGLSYSNYFTGRLAAFEQRFRRGDIDGAIRNSWYLAPGHDVIRKKVVDILRANPQDMAHPDPALPLPAAKPLLSTIAKPTLILVGEFDAPDNHAQAGVLEALIPGAKRVVVPGSGHLLYLERPDAFAGLIEPFAKTALTK